MSTNPAPAAPDQPAQDRQADGETAHTEVVGASEDFPLGEMKMATVGETRVAVIRTESGLHAIDNACPHQGYGLVTGSLDGELVTCQWHNWKFRVSDGECVLGQENVACHQVEERDGEVAVTVTIPSAARRREQLWPSLARGFDHNYSGQMARDTARLLAAEAEPHQIVGQAASRSQPREEYGIGHGLAMATDCLAMVPLYDGQDRTLPVVQALAAMAEPTLRFPTVDVPTPMEGDVDRLGTVLAEAIEGEDADQAMAAMLGLLEAGATTTDLLAPLTDAVGRHHLSYGHGAIYTQKSFELLAMIGWDHAPTILPHLVRSLVYGTREDTLPYMSKAIQEIDRLDPERLAQAPHRPDWVGTDGEALDRLVDQMLTADQAAIGATAQAIEAGAGVAGVLDAASLAASTRLLNYDHEVELDTELDFGWLDITHALTYVNAARWLHQRAPGPWTARLALFTVFLVHDSGRALRRGHYSPVAIPEPAVSADLESLAAAVYERRPDQAVTIALGGNPVEVGDELARLSLADGSGAWIVAAHMVKLAQAAREEAAVTGSSLPLAAAARFLAAPRRERFVAANVAEAISFVRTGTPPKR